MDIQDNRKDEGKQQASGNVDPENKEAHGLEGWDDDEDYKDSEDEGTEEKVRVMKLTDRDTNELPRLGTLRKSRTSALLLKN
eukprot:scaffold8165_cov90-Amphora_coffeaeformis.AAC.1